MILDRVFVVMAGIIYDEQLVSTREALLTAAESHVVCFRAHAKSEAVRSISIPLSRCRLFFFVCRVWFFLYTKLHRSVACLRDHSRYGT